MTDSSIAYRDSQFLESGDGRPIRILAEYLKPYSVLRDAGIQDTIVFFGSARLQPGDPLGHYYDEARALARQVTEWSGSLPCRSRRFVVCSGGGGGIMEAANRGASDAGGPSIGLNISLPHEQRPNAFITPELSLEFRYFFTRKFWFAHPARAMIAFPGGLGTLDELFEIMTLTQTRKLSRPILVLLYGKPYWQELINFPALLRHGMISQEDLDRIRYVDTPEQAMEVLRRELEVEQDLAAPALASSTCCSPSGSTPVAGKIIG